MTFKKKIRKTARAEKDWLCETYGSAFCVALEEWCDNIVERAPNNKDSLHLIPLEDILDIKHKPWSYVWTTVRDQTTFDRLRSLVTFIKNGKPPYELLAAHSRIFAQDFFWVNLIVVFQVDRVREEITFTYFNSYGDEHQH